MQGIRLRGIRHILTNRKAQKWGLFYIILAIALEITPPRQIAITSAPVIREAPLPGTSQATNPW